MNNVKEDEHQYTFAKTRYKSLIDRSYKKELHVLLFKKLIIQSDENFPIVDNIFNECDKDNYNSYKKGYSDMSVIRKRNSKIKSWISDQTNIQKKVILMNQFEERFKKNLSWNDFKEIYGKDDDLRQCEYCGITETQINKLINKDKIFTKRIYSRGRLLEVDRRNSYESYIKNNLVLACYWCNNAKTDEFEYEEFKPMGDIIKAIWEKRLQCLP